MQRYLWQQADGARHVYDTAEQYPPKAGMGLEVLCGKTVIPRTQEIHDGNLPCWFDPTCLDCRDQLALATGWTKDKLDELYAIGQEHHSDE